jgi:hypothetical protein
VPGGEDGPKARQHHIKRRVRNRQILGVPDFELDVHASLDRSLACVVEPGVGDVDPEDVPSGLGGGHRDGAGTRGNVKNALARVTAARSTNMRAAPSSRRPTGR